MSETVTGYIDHVIFRNEDNGYTVMVLKGMEEEQELTCVGTFPAITQGAAIEASGNYTTHPVYGKQFQIASYVEKMPEDALAMERYLGSDAGDLNETPARSRGSVRHWQPGSYVVSAMIPCVLWRKSRSVWLRSRESAKKRPWRSQNR